MTSITNQTEIIKLVPVSAVTVIGDQLKTTSLKVAEFFGKRHDDVLKRVKSLDCSSDFHQRNFAEMMQSVKIGKGATRESKYYEMTKDGFMFLVMGFTGKAAAQVKEAYIFAFNKMAEALQSKQHAKVVETLTPAMQRHIQKRVTEMTLCGSNLSYPQVYRQIKDAFKVGTYKDIPAKKYPDLCRFLKCKPAPEALQGELLQAEKAEPTQSVSSDGLTVTLPRQNYARYLVTVEDGKAVVLDAADKALIDVHVARQLAAEAGAVASYIESKAEQRDLEAKLLREESRRLRIFMGEESRSRLDKPISDIFTA